LGIDSSPFSMPPLYLRKAPFSVQKTRTTSELVSSKSVYGSFVTGPENANGAGVRQIYKLTLAGNGIATWTPIPGATSVTGGPATLVGRDGTSLVHLMGSQRPATNPVLNWSTP
jgi:hypothetical protein